MHDFRVQELFSADNAFLLTGARIPGKVARMSFTIIVSEDNGAEGDAWTERYRQSVPELDLLALINVVNKKPRKTRADRGAKRAEVK